MSQQRISHSSDLKRLRDEGYEIEIKGGHLLAHHIPYLNSLKEVKYGTIVTVLALKPPDHTAHFCGEIPCDINGNALNAIINSSREQQVEGNIRVNHYFSSKPATGNYLDYYEKITTYTEILCSQARGIDDTVTAKTFKVVADTNEKTLFKYFDTNSSRANIFQINSKVEGQKVAIIGLGGTGSYILDLLAKTHVSEIHLFDGDVFQQHNAFRSPGAPTVELLNTQPKKVDYFASIYSNMHNGIETSGNINKENIYLLEGMSYVFICIDKNEVKGLIMSKLRQFGVPFIDAGLGISVGDNNLIGTVRVTVGTTHKSDHLASRIGTEDIDENEYATNIQIADLNCLNATLAVLKWKKLSGFYQDLKEEHNILYSINTGQLINEDFAA